MPQFRLTAPGPYGAQQLQRWKYSQVLEVDGRVDISGQGGSHPDTLDYPEGVPLETEIERAFDKVTALLASVGLDWSHVAAVDTFHVPEPDGFIGASSREVSRQFETRMPHHKPIWTALGVVVLAVPRMRFEVRVVAFRDGHLPPSAPDL